MKRIHKPKTYVTTVLLSLFFVGMPVLLIMGGIYFAKEYPKVLNYVNSMCQVYTRNYKKDECQARYSTYTCYGPIWKVYHGPNNTIYAIVETEKRYRSYSDALNKANEYQIGMSYSCWYDTRNPSIAQWDKPNALIGIILLSCGGLSTLLFIMFCFLTYRFIQEQKLQNEKDMLYPYSYSVT